MQADIEAAGKDQINNTGNNYGQRSKRYLISMNFRHYLDKLLAL